MSSTTTPIRVLIIRNARGITDITGAETYLLSLMASLDSKRCEARLLCIIDPRRGETPWLKELKRREISFVTVPVASALSLKDVFSAVREVRRFDADIVHSIDHRADIVGITAAKLTGRVAVLSFFGWTNWEEESPRGQIYPWFDKQSMRFCDAMISDSAFIGRLIDKGPSGPPLVVIPHGINIEKFDPRSVAPSWRQVFFPEDDVRILGMVGRINPIKGQLEFVKAAKLLASSHPRARFVMIGDASPGQERYLQSVERLIEEQGLRGRVRITNVRHEQIPAALASMDIVVSPSQTESFSFVLLEAMAMERPIVATRVGGNPELINDGETGVLVAPGDFRELARAAASLLDDEGRCRKLGEQGRRKIKEELTFAAMGERTLKVYREVLNWRKQGRRGTLSNLELRRRLSQSS